MIATHASAPVAAHTTQTSRRTEVLVLLAGAVIAVGANAIVAASAIAAGANADFPALKIAVFAAFTVLGLVAAYLGWRIIRRRAAHPARVLSIVVPVLAVLSYIPDVALLITRFIPGTDAMSVAGLAVMHLVVLGVALPICQRLAPVRRVTR